MAERWRSPAARELAKAIRDAGGELERLGTGRWRVTGPSGTITIHEPGTDTRRDLARSSAARRIQEETGLNLS
jgi:hypothetical protein